MTPANPDALADARDLIRQSLKVGAPGLSESAREAVVRSIMLKLEGKVLAPLLADLQQVTAERDEAREEAYDLKLAAAGGEDAPGSASLVTADDVRRWRDEETRALRTAEARAAQLQAEVEALKAERDGAEAVITAYREAICTMAKSHRAVEAVEQRENERLRRHPIIRGAARAATAREGQADG